MNYSLRPEIIFRSRCPGAAVATSEVINSFLLFKITDFESSHLNIIVSPSKMKLTLMHLRWDIPSRKKKQVLCQAASLHKSFLLMSLPPNDRDRPDHINYTCSYIDRCQYRQQLNSLYSCLH